MAQLLKLTGIKTYAGRATQGEIVKQGDVCLFLDGIGEKVLRGSRVNKEGERVPYFERVSGVAPTYDFTGGKLAKPVSNAFVARPDTVHANVEDAGTPEVEAEEAEETVEEVVEAPVKAVPVKTQRKPASKTAK